MSEFYGDPMKQETANVKCTGDSCNVTSCKNDDVKDANVPADSNKDNNDSTSQEQKAPLGQINLLEVEINDPNTALNVMVGFLGLAQKRGAFAINESAKIYECINKFS